MRRWTLLSIIAAVFLAPAGLQAQMLVIPEDMGLGYSFTAGAAFVINGDLEEDVQPIIGVSWYGSSGDEFGSSTAIGVSAHWIPLERNDGVDADLIPVLLNYKAYGYASGYRLFTNLGIGILAATEDIPEMDIKNGANFGWTAGFGIDLTNQLFGQFRFIASDDPGDDGIVTAELGYRF